MAYYNTCSICGSNLDPGEICDCWRAAAAHKKPKENKAEKTKKTSQNEAHRRPERNMK